MQITDVTSMPLAMGGGGGDSDGGGDGGDYSDGVYDGPGTSTAGKVNHAVTYNVCSVSVCFSLVLICTAC